MHLVFRQILASDLYSAERSIVSLLDSDGLPTTAAGKEREQAADEARSYLGYALMILRCCPPA